MRDLHTEAMCWLRYGKRMPIVCTEAEPWRPDVLGISSSMAIEVEIKRSRADLRAEFKNKGAKHFAYANGGRYVPNYFYFYVPEALADYADEVASQSFPKAGVAVQTDTEHLDGKNTVVRRRPTQLHSGRPSQAFVKTAIRRMSSELCGRYVTLDIALMALDGLRSSAVEAAFRQAGALDVEDPEADLRGRAAELAMAVDQVVLAGQPEEVHTRWMDAARRLQEALGKELDLEALSL